MATNVFPFGHEDEDYIDMEIGSTQTSFFYRPKSAPHSSEFEFQMFSSSSERETTSPADELFYKGKLLPLHLPPRLQMVEKLLQISIFYQNHQQDNFDELFSTPLTTNANTTPTANTPFESCNISPLESCQVSRELNPEEYFSEYSTESNGKIPKKSWTQIIGSKLIKQSSLGSKLKASRAYVKSLFGKSACPDESLAGNLRDEEAVPKARESVTKYSKMAKEVPSSRIPKDKKKKSTTVIIRSFNKEKFAKDGGGHHRRSFSGAIKRFSTTKSSSSLFSSGTSTSSSLSNSEIENPIQGAIAHCKSSQQQIYPKNAINDEGFC